MTLLGGAFDHTFGLFYRNDMPSSPETLKSQSTSGTADVFERFKSYLDLKVETLTSGLVSQATNGTQKLERGAEAEKLKFQVNRDQFLFYSELQGTGSRLAGGPRIPNRGARERLRGREEEQERALKKKKQNAFKRAQKSKNSSSASSARSGDNRMLFRGRLTALFCVSAWQASALTLPALQFVSSCYASAFWRRKIFFLLGNVVREKERNFSVLVMMIH